MRIKNVKEDISYLDTQSFFNNRVNKYKNDNPYSVTMYQDNNPELVKKRNEEEIKKLLPLLKLDENSRVLDLACGIGRWSDAINTSIASYCGIDFCGGLIDIAKTRNIKSNRHFYQGRTEKFLSVIKENNVSKYNRVLIIGSLMYLNDNDVLTTMQSLAESCMEHTIICVREPIGIEERLTLKEQFSDELNDTYNAIYRTREELKTVFTETLLKVGFIIAKEEFLFNNSELNNRKETAQYYYILER